MHWFKLVLLTLWAVDLGLRIAIAGGYEPPKSTKRGAAIAAFIDLAIIIGIWQYV